MKKLVTAALLVLCAVCVVAQVASDFRIVNGKLYNIRKSALWINLPPEDSYGTYNAVWYHGWVESVGESSIIVRMEAETLNGPSYKNEWHDRSVLIKNHPQQKKFSNGDKFSRDRFFPLGNQTLTNRSGDRVITVRAYDYGLPNTPTNRAVFKGDLDNNQTKGQ
jgi:hypothetical protein